MNLSRVAKISLFTLLIFFVGYIIYYLVGFGVFLDDMGECGMSGGPCRGVKVELDLKKNDHYEYITCKNGKIGFIQSSTENPIIFKIDKEFNLKWAYRLETDSCSGIPMNKMSGMKLKTNAGVNSINFFNQTYSEPGTIYLTSDFDFDYLCLNSM